MVTDYEYENLFAEHITADFVIVDSGASVTANAGHEPTISDEEFIITNDELQSETIKLSESLCSDQNLTFGKMEASKLTFTLKNKADYPTNLSNTEIDVYLYFNGDSDTLFKVGRYTIDSDKYSDDRYTRSITAYDMIYYLKSLDITEWYNAYYEDGQSHMLGLVILNLFNWISDPNDEYPNSPKIDIQLESGYNLCNGTFSLGRTIESDSITFEFFMQRILEFNGAFGHINRQGNFEFVVMQWYDSQPVRTVTNDYRIPPTPFDSVSTWGIGGIDVYNEDNIRKFTVRNTNKKVPSIYVIVDSFVLSDRDAGDSDVEAALKRLHQVINHYNYKSCKTACTGDLCVEVGDRINVRLIQDETNPLNWFRSYVLERTFTGIQGMTDVYQAKGDQKQPVYTVNNDNWHSGDSSGSTSGSGTGGVAVVDDEINKKFVEIIRNIGYRLLNEPDVHLEYNKSAGQVEINWEDPTDITTYNPLPVEWAGTVVVRKEGKSPLHRYGGKFGGTLLVDSTTRDQYKLSSYIDNTIEPNKKYFYGIFPYSIGLDDADHPIRHYRFTKVISVDTTVMLVAPTIYPIQEGQIVGTTVTVNYSIPTLEEGSYTVQKLVVKKNSIPTSKTDGDKIIDLNPDTSLLINSVTVTGLDELSQYYFVIFIEDEIGSEANSDPEDCIIGELPGTVFDYTGSIQTFTVPEDGVYQLETWGAQGQNEDDLHGGYGGYSVGKMFLRQGQTLYINVGGQNGYGGGGGYVSGNIRNIIIPDSGQALIYDERAWLWQSTYSAGYPFGSGDQDDTRVFGKGTDLSRKVISGEAQVNQYYLLWERNGIKCYYGITSSNATYGQRKYCCCIVNENNERCVGSLTPRETYTQEFYGDQVFFDMSGDYYNSNVKSRLNHWSIAYGVDDINHLGYVCMCYESRYGYYAWYLFPSPTVSYDSSYYGWNAAKLYDALIRASE